MCVCVCACSQHLKATPGQSAAAAAKAAADKAAAAAKAQQEADDAQLVAALAASLAISGPVPPPPPPSLAGPRLVMLPLSCQTAERLVVNTDPLMPQRTPSERIAADLGIPVEEVRASLVAQQVLDDRLVAIALR